MARKNPAAVALGRRGGRRRSDAKTIAVRVNAARGGRPREEPVPVLLLWEDGQREPRTFSTLARLIPVRYIGPDGLEWMSDFDRTEDVDELGRRIYRERAR